MKSRFFIALGMVAAPFANALLISVNFEQWTPTPGTFALESELVGPRGGLGTEWNQFADEDSAGTLVDSTGAPTSVEFTTNFSEGRGGGAGNTPMLRSTLTDFGRGQSRTLTITGLEAGAAYDIWLASFRDSSAARERTVGTWTTSNTTSSSSSQMIDNRAGRNGTTFVEGYNYIVFESIVADGTGRIVFDGKGATTADGFDDDYRLGLSGFQIADSPPREPLEITDVVYDPGSDEVTLTWKSNPGEFYGLYWSGDLGAFEPGIHPAVPADENGNRTSHGPFANPLPGASRVFFRVGEPDLEDPDLRNLWGNDTTVTLVFSEPMHPGGATDPANYSVRDGDALWPILSADLSGDGLTVTLTLGSPLAIGTTYTVTMHNLTDLAGRSLGDPATGEFQTWDNDPDGVKVFILAGQSNMVGHGKSEDGHGDVPGAIGSLRYQVNNDPANYGHLVDGGGNWIVRDDVKVWWRDSDLEEPRGVIKGDLRIGYSQSRNSSWFGPEYGFGWAVGDYYDEDVLIIKCAWGGKSLNVDFRPPSAVAARGGKVGPYYTGMIDYVRDCLTHLGTEFPEFAGRGYQIAGFGWHQGWNDRIDFNNSAAYEENLVDLIHDLRAEFGRPGLPVSITTTGMAPPAEYTTVELAQLAVADPAEYPGFDGNVVTTDTRPFWRDASISPSSFGYHWNHNGESQFLNGTAMGEGMVGLIGGP